MAPNPREAVSLAFARRVVELTAAMEDVPPVLLVFDPETGEREEAGACPLSAGGGRAAILMMTFCNPLALHAAGAIEGIGG